MMASSFHSMALKFEVLERCSRSRTSVLKLPNYNCETPMFMPVGTRGTVKGMTVDDMIELECQLILGNTYHLENAPGSKLIEKIGGLHEFTSWPRAILTDSGGFQMVSLLEFANIKEEGVEFKSPVDGTKMLLTPEESIAIQNRLGADIIMALDDVVPSTSNDPERFKEATYRTTRWLDRCINAHQRPNDQSLFPIVQGGLDIELRSISIEELIKRNCSGYAIGGLAGGEDKDAFCKIIEFCLRKLPEDKPKYIMGIGYPVDIVICCALGADMFDSVYPTRTARFGVALTPKGPLKLKHAKYNEDFTPIDDTCQCMVCKTYTKAILNFMITKKTILGSRLLTYHNLYYMMNLMKDIRESIKNKTFSDFVKSFLKQQYNSNEIPSWIISALNYANIDIHL